MKYIDVREASQRWGISDRRIRILCNEGRIDGAIKLGWSWTIPDDTPKPRDGRVLRHFRNLDIRPGFVDVERLSSLSDEFPIELQPGKGYLKTLIKSSLLYFLSYYGKSVTEDDVETIISGSIVSSISLEMHLFVLSFFSSMKSLFDRKEDWNDKEIREAYRIFMRTIDDDEKGYRVGFSKNAVRGKDKVRVDVQMETLLTQYEAWKNLHPFLRGVMFYGELERIEPFKCYSSVISYFLLSGELIRGGILPPVLSPDDREDLRLSSFIAFSRGNYRDLTSFMEKKVYQSYQMAKEENEKGGDADAQGR